MWDRLIRRGRKSIIDGPLFVYLLPPTPHKTNHVWMGNQREQQIDDHDLMYGSMDKLMNVDDVNMCRMDTVAELMESNMTKLNLLSII